MEDRKIWEPDWPAVRGEGTRHDRDDRPQPPPARVQRPGSTPRTGYPALRLAIRAAMGEGADPVEVERRTAAIWREHLRRRERGERLSGPHPAAPAVAPWWDTTVIGFGEQADLDRMTRELRHERERRDAERMRAIGFDGDEWIG